MTDPENDARRGQQILPEIKLTGRPSASPMLERLRFARGTVFYLLIWAFVYVEVAGATTGGPYHAVACRLVLCVAGGLGIYLVHRRSHVAPVGGRIITPEEDESEEPQGVQ